MPKKAARKAIDELDVELKQIPRDTGPLERMLAQAREEIEDLTPEAIKDLVETLQQEADELEAEYPRTTALINQVMHALSGLGI